MGARGAGAPARDASPGPGAGAPRGGGAASRALGPPWPRAWRRALPRLLRAGRGRPGVEEVSYTKDTLRSAPPFSRGSPTAAERKSAGGPLGPTDRSARPPSPAAAAPRVSGPQGAGRAPRRPSRARAWDAAVSGRGCRRGPRGSATGRR